MTPPQTDPGAPVLALRPCRRAAALLLATAVSSLWSARTSAAQPTTRPSPTTHAARKTKRAPVLAFYYTWYGTPFGPAKRWTHWGKAQGGVLAPKGTDPRRIWFHPGLRDIASCAYPLVGPYDSRQKEIVRWHVRLAKAAGIDAFLVDWWGPGNWQKPPGQTYRAFIDVLLPIAEQEHFKVALCDELPQFYKNFDDVIRWTGDSLARFGKSPAYLRIQGRPVYYIYQVWQGRMSVVDCRRLIRSVEQRVGDVYWIVDKMRCRLARNSPNGRELFFPDEWLAVKEIDALGGYATFSNMRVHEYKDLRVLYDRLVRQGRSHGKQVLLAVHPGLDNSKFNLKPYVMPRRDGQTLRHFLRAADEAGADLIAVTSFNEWPETTVIEPAWTWPDPYRYLKVVAEFTRTPWRRPPLPPANALDPLMVPLLRSRGPATRPSGEKSTPRGPGKSLPKW